jgi:poly(hydroxyalkanoate) depolymerase family esterase
MLPYDFDPRVDGGARPPTDHRRRRARRVRRAWPAVVCLVALLTAGVAANSAVAATSAPIWGVPWTWTPSWWPKPPTQPVGTPSTPSGPGTTPTPTPPPSSTPGQLPGTVLSDTFTNSGGSLVYLGYVPSSYKPGTPMPLVVALHGCTQSAGDFRQLTRWDQLAEAKGFIVVFPQQSKDDNSMKCWNFFQQNHMKRGTGEPEVIAGITRSIQQHYTVDPHRIYVNGLSAGGAMASVMAATYPDIFAAAGIGSGCEYAATAACAGYKSADPATAGSQAYQAMGQYARQMPVILFEGDQDTTVPPVNAQQLVQQWQVTDDYADTGGKDGSIPVQPTGVTRGTAPGGRAYTVTTYGDKDRKELIQSWLVSGMGHAWSGGCSCQQYADPAGPDETGAMYAFFMAHPMP